MKHFLALFLLFAACSAADPFTKQTIKFPDGKTGEVTTEIVSESEHDRVLNVSFVFDGKVTKETEVFKRVNEIWERVKIEAEKREIDEGLIKFVYISDFDQVKQKPVYEMLLFEASQAESGRWTIQKVD